MFRLSRAFGLACALSVIATASPAKAAGIDRKTFHRLINKYQIRD